MRHSYNKWTKEQIDFLKKNYEQMPNDDILDGLRAIGWEGGYKRMVNYANRMLRLRKVNIDTRHEKRRKTIAREMRRMSLDMYPMTDIQNLGHPEPLKLRGIRSYLKTRRGYICKRFDHNIYYDQNTSRSKKMEAKLRELGIQLRQITTEQ